MQRLGIVRSVLVAIGVVMVFAGCSGSSSSSKATTTTTTVPAITKADYITQANALCQTMNDGVKSIPDPGSDPTKVADAIDQTVEITTDTLAKLRALPLPAGDEATLQAIFAKVDALISDYHQVSAALGAGDKPTATQLNETGKADQKAANDASNAYGLTVCGS